MAKKEAKTNAMRMLEKLGIAYTAHEYDCDGFMDGVEVADMLGLAHEVIYKTLVTVGADRQHYVFVIPVEKELDLKKCARSVGVKSVAMLPVKDLFALTGYVRGGCTSVGMKKQFATRIDESALALPQMYVSAGRLGCQMCLAPRDLATAVRAEFADLTQE